MFLPPINGFVEGHAECFLQTIRTLSLMDKSRLMKSQKVATSHC